MRASKRIKTTGAAAALSIGIAACGGDAPVVEPKLRPVRTVKVAAATEGVPRTLAGVSRAGIESRLSFRVPGTVDRVSASLGEAVRRGQALARLDPTDYELRVEEAEAGLAQARASLRKAEADWERVVALYENNNASRSEYDAALAARESARAQVDARGKQLEQARQQVGYTVLRAPADGAIASVDVEVNENVRAGQQIFLLTSGVRPEVEVGVPEVLIAQVEEGQPVTVRFDALPGREFAARVIEVGVAVTGSASTFTARARLLEVAPEVRSGLAAEVTFRFGGPGETRLVVPSVAIGEDRQGRFVFVLERDGEEGIVRRRPVGVGGPVAALEGIEILDGLEPGEEIVTAGVRTLTDGMRVEAPPEGGA